MLKKIFLTAFVISAMLSCKKSSSTSDVQLSHLSFWVGSDLGLGKIAVSCNGLTDTIRSSNSSIPNCGTSGCANFDLKAGYYSYTATAGSTSWTGSFDVYEGCCTSVKLTADGASTLASGNATFWLASDLGYGSITVNVNGISQKITKYSAYTPSCGTSGFANFSLLPGTYSFTATGDGGGKWSGTITVSSGSCSKMQLY